MSFARWRVAELLHVLELMAAGEVQRRLPVSPLHDELDAIAYAVNVLAGELWWSSERALEAHAVKEAELREAALRAERANDSKNVFLRNVNHEIRTPITAMLGFADLLASDDLSQQDRADLVRRLRANGQAVLALLSDLLDLARMDADKLVLTPEPVSIFDLIREVQSSLELEIRAKGLVLRIEVASDAFETIQTDRYRLRQIVVNLIGNAVKFTESGGVLVSLRTEIIDHEKHWIVDISDTGIGIAGDRQSHLFEPFEQADSSITPLYGGSGLGLALSRRLAEQLGGSLVLLESTPGKGTTFRLSVKPLSTKLTSAASAAKESRPTAREISGLRVLLADDHPDIQLAVRRLLEQAGATVELARDGREAVAMATSRPFDIALMDLRMPVVDGLQATRTLRSGGYAVPIVALTADPAPMRREEALDAGCDACLCKPFTLGDLLTSIRELRARRA